MLLKGEVNYSSFTIPLESAVQRARSTVLRTMPSLERYRAENVRCLPDRTPVAAKLLAGHGWSCGVSDDDSFASHVRGIVARTYPAS